MSNKKTVNYEILITGATGFVGRRLVEEIKDYYPQRKILLLGGKESSEKNIKTEKEFRKFGLELYRVDLTKKSDLKFLPKNPKIVIHLAAQTNTSIKDHCVNDIGVKNLCRSIGKLNRNTHFIYIGTMVNVVGRPICDLPVDEMSRYYPTNEYTRTKTRGEKYLVDECKKSKFRLTILVPNTIYGKGYRENSLFDILKRGIASGSFIFRFNWPGRSALIHVDDVVSAIVSFSKIKPRPGQPEKYFLYSENLTVAQISRKIHKELGIKYNEVKIPTSLWKLISEGRKYILLFEKILPYRLYNQLWRIGIIVDDVVYTKSTKVSNKLKDWKPKHLRDTISNVIH